MLSLIILSGDIIKKVENL